MTLVTRLFILALPIALTSCSFLASHSVIQNRDKAYLTARSFPPLRIPPGVSAGQFENAYPVSNRQYPRELQDVSIAPPGLNP